MTDEEIVDGYSPNELVESDEHRLLKEAVALLEMDEEGTTPGTGTWFLIHEINTLLSSR